MIAKKSPKFIQAATEMLAEEISGFSNFSSKHSMELSMKIIPEIDWENEALMHKGFSWIAKNYLTKKGLIN